MNIDSRKRANGLPETSARSTLVNRGSAGSAFTANLFIATLTGLLAVPISGSLDGDLNARGTAALAQDGILVYDYNGDGRVTCADFEEEFPNSFTEEATAALARFPDELSDLNRDNDETACDPSGDTSGEEPVEPEPIPSDLPSDLPPATIAPPAPTTVEAPGGCDVEVRNGRAFVFTDCADGTVRAGFEPFEGFDEFAARAQNGFGAFDDTESEGTASIEVQQAVPVSGSNSTTTSQDRASSDTRLVEGEQRARDGKAKKAKKKKARKAKKKRAAALKAKRMRQARDDRDD